MDWWKISIVLCCYGFFKEYRPSEPFIVSYLTSFKNFTIEQINQQIFPLGTYFYLSLLVAAFLLTDFLRYKPVLLVGGVSGIITWCLLIYGQTIQEMQVLEFFYGVFMAAEVAYYSYIYAAVDKIQYKKVTSHSRAAILVGKACAGLSSQLLINFKILNYLQLNYLTVGGFIMATLASLFLPAVSQTIYFHRNIVNNSLNNENYKIEHKNQFTEVIDANENKQYCRSAFSLLYINFKNAFKNIDVLKWSIWWALATCGYLQVISYCQSLWEDIIIEDNSTLYNGYIEFVTSLLGAFATACIGWLKTPKKYWSELGLGFLTIFQGSLLFYSACLKKLYLVYILYVLYQMLYHAAVTVAAYEVVKLIKERSCGLVFGVNMFLALAMQTLLTSIVINILQINVRNQFKIYGLYHIFIGTVFLIVGILPFRYLLFSKLKKKSQIQYD